MEKQGITWGNRKVHTSLAERDVCRENNMSVASMLKSVSFLHLEMLVGEHAVTYARSPPQNSEKSQRQPLPDAVSDGKEHWRHTVCNCFIYKDTSRAPH